MNKLLVEATLVGRGYAGLRGARAAILRSSARRCRRASAAPLSRNLARAGIRANPASLVKHPGSAHP
jgi:hypothetical protein